ncbi:hypothetical protein ACTXT7_003888 [Hymenolepis weldensis]
MPQGQETVEEILNPLLFRYRTTPRVGAQIGVHYRKYLRSRYLALTSKLKTDQIKTYLDKYNPNMVLRSNSLATKAIELYLKQVGGPYLKSALGEFVTSVLAQTAAAAIAVASTSPNTEASQPLSTKERRAPLGRMQSSKYLTRSISVEDENQRVSGVVDFEVDPDKVTNSKQLLRNQANLIKLVRDVWRRIQATIASFPNELRITFAAIREAMMPTSTSDGFKSPRNEYGGLFEHVISACVFLRFVCPAILSPSLFALADNFADNTRAPDLTSAILFSEHRRASRPLQKNPLTAAPPELLNYFEAFH